MRECLLEFRQPDGTWFAYTETDKVSIFRVAIKLTNSPTIGEIQVRDPHGMFVYYVNKRK